MLSKLKKKIKKIFRRRIKSITLSYSREERMLGRCALITGGSSGIGLAIAKAYLDSGCKVIIVGRNVNKLNDAKNKLNHPNLFAYKMDLKDVASMNNRINEIEKIVNTKIDILVNNAGVSCSTSFPNISVEDYDAVMETNLKGTLFLSQAFSQYLISNKIRGNILNIGSSSGLRPANSSYALSKWGIRGLTLGMAKSLIKYDIVVNGIAPGPTATTMITEDINNLYGAKNDAGRLVHTLEISELAVQLVSDCSRMIIGEMININGGSGTLTFDDIEY